MIYDIIDLMIKLIKYKIHLIDLSTFLSYSYKKLSNPSMDLSVVSKSMIYVSLLNRSLIPCFKL